MTTGDMIRELRRLEEAHRDDFVGVGETNWTSMCHDVANRLEELLKAQEPISVQKKRMAIDGLQMWDCVCGACGQTLLFSANFCPWCGRAVKWE